MDNNLKSKVTELVESKDYGKYAWFMYSEYAEGRLTLKALADIIELCCTEEYEAEEIVNNRPGGEARYEYHEAWAIWDAFGVFAGLLLKKGVLDGRFQLISYEVKDGDSYVSTDEITDDETSIDLNDLSSLLPPDETGNYESVLWLTELVSDIRSFNESQEEFISKEEFVLEPLNHCTQQNAFAILALLDYIVDHQTFTPEELENTDRCPEDASLEDLLETYEDIRAAEDVFSFFVQEADHTERELEAASQERMESASTVAEAVIAATELDFWHHYPLHFPYTLYNIIDETPVD